jgi:hypothetical protein
MNTGIIKFIIKLTKGTVLFAPFANLATHDMQHSSGEATIWGELGS